MQDHPLPLFVSTFVPLRLLEIQQAGGATEQDFERIRAFVPDLAEHGDALLYRERGRTGEMAGRLIDTIAVLAFLPGGVTIFGQHFEAVENGVGMSNADEYMARQRADPEQCKRFGSAMARLELGQLLYDAGEQQGLTVAQMAAQLGVKPEYLEGLVQGEDNPRIGQVGAWMAALGYQLKITIEPLERKGGA